MYNTYLLIFRVKTYVTTKVGALGTIIFQPGHYIYIGSAKNTLRQRINRHFKRTKPLRWHIDYLTTQHDVEIEKVYITHSKTKQECRIAKLIAHNGIPVPGFGSSDCKCKSHLYRINGIQNINFERMGMREYEGRQIRIRHV